jgi:hypothetical protein
MQAPPGRLACGRVRAEPERLQLGEVDQVVLALGDPRDRKVTGGLVTKRPIYGRNVTNPLHGAQHAGRKATWGLRALRNGRHAVVVGHHVDGVAHYAADPLAERRGPGSVGNPGCRPRAVLPASGSNPQFSCQAVENTVGGASWWISPSQ